MVHGISLIFGTSLMAFSLPHLLSAQSTRVKDKELLRGKVFRVSEYEVGICVCVLYCFGIMINDVIIRPVLKVSQCCFFCVLLNNYS